MNGLYIFLIVISSAILYHFIKRALAKGEIIDGYVIDNKKNPYLLLLIDYETSSVSKGGIFSFHTYKFKKIYLQELSVEYEVKIAGFGSKMLDGYVYIFGMNEDFFFVATHNNDLVIINNKTGKKQCNKKQIIKINPKLKDFNINLCKYCEILQSIIIFDNQGYAYLLNPETIIAEQIDFKIDPYDLDQSYILFEDLPQVKLNDNYINSREPNPFIAGSNKYDVNFISDKGSKRYFVHIITNLSNEKPKGLDKTYLNPEIMNKGTCTIPYLTVDPPSVVIAHMRNLNPKIEDIYISKVDAKSKEHWKLNITEIAVNPKFSKYSYLYFTEFNDKIYFIYTKTSSDKVSISVVDKNTGNIIKKPILFVNRRI